MKKITFAASMAIAAAVFVSCGKSTPKADFKNDVDSLSYAIGLDQSQGVKEYLSRMEIDTAYMDDFVKGLNEGASAGDDKKQAAYNAGVSIGLQLNMMQKGINRQLFGADSTQSISMKNFIAGFIAGATGKDAKMTLEQARMVEQTKSEAITKRSMAKTYGKNKEASEKFMKENADKQGMKKLDKGVFYKVIKEGSGNIPSDTATVMVHYEGKTIDGKVFDSSYKRKEPATMKVNQVIPGFTQALTHMPVGSVWEVYIPYDQAYGDRDMGQIKPYSALIFKIELVSINK